MEESRGPLVQIAMLTKALCYWQSEVDAGLSVIQTHARNLRGAGPPTRRTRAVHSHVQTAMDKLAEGDRLPRAGVIDCYNVSAVQRDQPRLRGGQRCARMGHGRRGVAPSLGRW